MNLDDKKKHKKNMQQLKKNVEKSINKANISRGVGVFLTGNGKGKTSSAFGMAIELLAMSIRLQLYNL